MLDWLAETTGARLLTTTSLTALSQPEEAVSIIAGRLAGYDIWRFTALQTTCAVAGSLVLAMAMVEGRLSAAETFALSQLDETYEIEQWGEDAEAMARRQALLQEIEAATRLLELV